MDVEMDAISKWRKAEFLGVDEAIKAGVGIKEKRLCMHEQREKEEPS